MIDTIALWLGYGFMLCGSLIIMAWLLLKLLVFLMERFLGLFSLRAWSIMMLGWNTYRKLPPDEKKKYKHIARENSNHA